MLLAIGWRNVALIEFSGGVRWVGAGRSGNAAGGGNYSEGKYRWQMPGGVDISRSSDGRAIKRGGAGVDDSARFAC